MSGAKLRRVNNDSSWLLSIPTDPIYRTSTFNLLIDPWLDESEQVDYHAAFSGQKRTTPALANSVQGLESILEQEGREEEERKKISEEEKESEEEGGGDTRPASQRIDAIILSHPFTDHMHPPTLKNDESITNGRIPLFVTRDSKSALESLLGGKKKIQQQYINIIEMSKTEEGEEEEIPSLLQFDTNKITKISSLPSNLEIIQVIPKEKFSILSGAAGIAWGKLHGAVIVLWKSYSRESRGEGEYHSILYTPHGITPLSTPAWLQSNQCHHEAILTSLDKIVLPNWLSGIVNLGLPAAIELIDKGVYDAKYILATHDERKEAKGLVASLIKRYWLGQETPDARNDGLTTLKQRDERRQEEGQAVVDVALASTAKATRVRVLKVGEVMTL